MSNIYSKRFILLFVSLLTISLSIVYATTTPREFERFMSISTFGSDELIYSYYPNPNSVIKLGDNITWYIHVFNRMGNSELIAIRVKLLNSTDLGPSLDHKPSPINSIYETEYLLKNNSTFILPLNWQINSIERVDDYIIIRSMTINNNTSNDLAVRSINGEDFRFVIELWRYNPESDRYEFAWKSNNDIKSVWNQIWFNVI